MTRNGPGSAAIERYKEGTMPYRFAVAAMLFLLCGVALAGPERVVPEGGAGAAMPGASTGPAADFTLPDLDGRPVALGPFLGKTPVLLVFWATWCPECKAAIPEINALTTGPLAEKLQIFGLDYRESREKVALAVTSRGIRYTVLLDEHGQAAKAYGVVGIPTYVLIDRRGYVAYRDHVLPGDISRYL
ncbi:MAG TPA: TlpA disulfide reductase family protein [Candidatus Binatia bacterium]|nr:TlpA disulfide reductase family protein [Candidatus Binatia bacterium]